MLFNVTKNKVAPVKGVFSWSSSGIRIRKTFKLQISFIFKLFLYHLNSTYIGIDNVFYCKQISTYCNDKNKWFVDFNPSILLLEYGQSITSLEAYCISLPSVTWNVENPKDP